MAMMEQMVEMDQMDCQVEMEFLVEMEKKEMLETLVYPVLKAVKGQQVNLVQKENLDKQLVVQFTLDGDEPRVDLMQCSFMKVLLEDLGLTIKEEEATTSAW
ncbi:uncharacterized protein [Watersipora subatra]|uniref:uncharacterized protein n=1 Tax=Watersipora subatra TaxID=2589382 RepID=UPI00355BA3A0